MGGISTREQSELSFETLHSRGLSTPDIIDILAENRAFAKHEHALKMGMAEFAYEIVDGRLYSATFKIFFDDLVNPPLESRASDYPAMPDHVIENLKEAQRLLVTGEVEGLALLSPAQDFAAEGSSKGQVYFMRRVGDRVLVVSTDHSEDPWQMQQEARSIFGVNSDKPIAGNTLNGGGIYGVTRTNAPTREEIVEAIRALGNEALAQQYERAIYLGEGIRPQDYLAKLIEREKHDILSHLESRGISIQQSPNQALREAFHYVERELQSIRESTFQTEKLSGVVSGTHREPEYGQITRADFLFKEDPTPSFSYSQNVDSYRVPIDPGRMHGDALYRIMRESEMMAFSAVVPLEQSPSRVAAAQSLILPPIERSSPILTQFEDTFRENTTERFKIERVISARRNEQMSEDREILKNMGEIEKGVKDSTRARQVEQSVSSFGVKATEREAQSLSPLSSTEKVISSRAILENQTIRSIQKSYSIREPSKLSQVENRFTTDSSNAISIGNQLIRSIKERTILVVNRLLTASVNDEGLESRGRISMIKASYHLYIRRLYVRGNSLEPSDALSIKALRSQLQKYGEVSQVKSQGMLKRAVTELLFKMFPKQILTRIKRSETRMKQIYSLSRELRLIRSGIIRLIKQSDSNRSTRILEQHLRERLLKIERAFVQNFSQSAIRRIVYRMLGFFLVLRENKSPEINKKQRKMLSPIIGARSLSFTPRMPQRLGTRFTKRELMRFETVLEHYRKMRVLNRSDWRVAHRLIGSVRNLRRALCQARGVVHRSRRRKMLKRLSRLETALELFMLNLLYAEVVFDFRDDTSRIRVSRFSSPRKFTCCTINGKKFPVRSSSKLSSGVRSKKPEYFRSEYRAREHFVGAKIRQKFMRL